MNKLNQVAEERALVLLDQEHAFEILYEDHVEIAAFAPYQYHV